MIKSLHSSCSSHGVNTVVMMVGSDGFSLVREDNENGDELTYIDELG